MSRKSKNAITINARLLQGVKLDKLADGRLAIKNGKTCKAPGGYSPPGRVVCAVEPGLFVRFNTTTYDHAFGVVTKRVKDKTTGQVTGGDERIIGKLSEFHVETTDGRRKYDLDRLLSTCRDWYLNGKPETDATSPDGITLDACFDIWRKAGKRGKKNKPRKQTGIDQVRRYLDVFASDWLGRPIASITSDEIENRADDISDGEFLSPVSLKTIGGYCEARRFLLSCSAIHNLSDSKHRAFNEFALRLKSYPQDDGKQRRFTDEELRVVFGFRREDCRQKNGDANPGAFDPLLWLRFLQLRFQLLSGYRISEVLAIRDQDIKREASTPHVVSGDDPTWFIRKSARSHWLPLTPALEAILDEAIATRDSVESMAGGETVFCNRDGKRYTSGSASFNPVRDLLVSLNLIRKEQVPENGKRLIRSHDARRTLGTIALARVESVTSDDVGAILDHSDSSLAATIYNCETDEDRLAKLATVAPKLEAINNAILEIARGNA